MVQINLGRAIKVYRAAHDIRQIDLAKQFGIAQSALSLIENNRPCPHVSADTRAALAKLVGWEG